ncbi:hypothetical protein ILYODFUR_021948 [Ilyodon furcidens]|uniref:Uncharacterized protein n=1 Tax=Ilyodon furcidens TaxID=33524 RepID=A0ABV0VFZ8_9TELE
MVDKYLLIKKDDKLRPRRRHRNQGDSKGEPNNKEQKNAENRNLRTTEVKRTTIITNLKLTACFWHSSGGTFDHYAEQDLFLNKQPQDLLTVITFGAFSGYIINVQG